MKAIPFCGVALTTALLASCASAPSTLTLISSSPAKTAQAKTARLWEEVKTTPATASSIPAAGVDVTSTGEADFAARRVHLTTQVAGQDIDVIAAGTTIYEKIPKLASAMGGKPWIKIDLDQIAKAVGISGLGNLSQAQSSDPTQGLQALRGASDPVVTVGHESVRAVKTTHYRVPVDFNKAAIGLPPDQQATLRQIVDKFGITTTSVDTWLDDQGRVRRFHYLLDYSAAKPQPGLPAAALPKSVEITLEMFDFGAPLSITIPGADQVADLPQPLSQPGSTG